MDGHLVNRRGEKGSKPPRSSTIVRGNFASPARPALSCFSPLLWDLRRDEGEGMDGDN